MSLRKALHALPDDRGSVHAAREVIACFATHVGEPLPAARVGRSTGLDVDRVVPVLEALARVARDRLRRQSEPGSCTFKPDAVLQLEVERYLRSGSSDTARRQSSLGKFRSRLGQG